MGWCFLVDRRKTQNPNVSQLSASGIGIWCWSEGLVVDYANIGHACGLQAGFWGSQLMVLYGLIFPECWRVLGRVWCNLISLFKRGKNGVKRCTVMVDPPKLVHRNNPHPNQRKMSTWAWLCHIFFCALDIDCKRRSRVDVYWWPCLW